MIEQLDHLTIHEVKTVPLMHLQSHDVDHPLHLRVPVLEMEARTVVLVAVVLVQTVEAVTATIVSTIGSQTATVAKNLIV
jgi:hypothetical protein